MPAINYMQTALEYISLENGSATTEMIAVQIFGKHLTPKKIYNLRASLRGYESAGLVVSERVSFGISKFTITELGIKKIENINAGVVYAVPSGKAAEMLNAIIAISANNGTASRKAIQDFVQAGYLNVSNRLGHLLSRDLIERVSRANYAITDEGRKYLKYCSDGESPIAALISTTRHSTGGGRHLANIHKMKTPQQLALMGA